MGYVIRYGTEEPVTKAPKIYGTRLSVMTAGFFLMFLMLAKLFWPAGSDKVREFLLPGDAEATGRAVTVLVEDLRAGEPVGDAVKAFCGEILTHAEYPD